MNLLKTKIKTGGILPSPLYTADCHLQETVLINGSGKSMGSTHTGGGFVCVRFVVCFL